MLVQQEFVNRDKLDRKNNYRALLKNKQFLNRNLKYKMYKSKYHTVKLNRLS